MVQHPLVLGSLFGFWFVFLGFNSTSSAVLLRGRRKEHAAALPHTALCKSPQLTAAALLLCCLGAGRRALRARSAA